MAKGGEGGDFPIPGVAEIHPKGLLEAISYIDQNFANEIGGCIINSRFLTTKQRLEFMEVGVRSSLVSGMISAVLTPIAIGVLERHIPIFGDSSPTFLDQSAALLLAVSFYVGYAIFIAKSTTCYIGEYTRSMVRNLLGGMTLGSTIKAVAVFLAFQTLYFYGLKDKYLAWIASQFFRLRLKHETAVKVFIWMQGFRETLLTSANFVVLTTLIFTVIPWIAYLYAKFRNKKLIEAGIVKLEARAF